MNEAEMSAEMVEATARVCRSTYAAARRMYHERIGQPGGNYDPSYWDEQKADGRYSMNRVSIWERMAKFFLRHDLDPVTCIHARFAALREVLRPPMPNQIASPRFLDTYQKISDLSEFDVEVMLRANKELAVSRLKLLQTEFGMNRRQSVRHLLLDDVIELTPLFKFCLATYEKMTRLADKYFMAASLQYLLHADLYDKLWTEWLPDDFRQLARVARERALMGGRRD